ncbi:hypothetical protein ACOI1C_15095 [Bacillus sp. DJP31]|uniref:hypothetical protein n=1 Tax=Bacillus sp. DJP31 TaxID=3409789 RepID=UPI003BB5714F
MELNINEQKPLDLYYKKSTNKSLNLPIEIDKTLVPDYLREHIDQKELNEYNSNLIDEIEKVKNYNQEIKIYIRVTEMGVPFKIELSNTGKAIANNVYVEVTFPNEIEVIEAKIEDFTKPRVPRVNEKPSKERRNKI